MRRLRDVGEHAWIARFLRDLNRHRRRGRVVVGPGDDAAVVRPGGRALLLTTDTLVENVHFRAGWASPSALGRRAFRVSVSDLAAMGGIPAFALLSLEAPPRLAVRSLDALVRGFATAARASGARLVGGNLAASSHLAITVALVGEAPARVVTRAGGRAGDALYLTGTIGGAGLAVRRLRAGRRGRLPDPPLRVRAGRWLAPLAHAMIDVSDGLVQDVGHLCRASGVAAELELDQLPLAPGCRRALGRTAPCFAATAGEDYELVVAVPPRRERLASRLSTRLGCRLSRVGRLVAGRPAVRILDAGGQVVELPRRGFDHFT